MLIRYLLTSVAPIIERAHFSARKRFLGPTDEDFWSNFNSVAPKGTPHSPSTYFSSRAYVYAPLRSHQSEICGLYKICEVINFGDTQRDIEGSS